MSEQSVPQWYRLGGIIIDIEYIVLSAIARLVGIAIAYNTT